MGKDEDMFKPISLWLSYKYIRSPQNYRLISLTAFSSCLGLALGIAVLITVLSVMNGFDYEIHQRMFKLVRQVSIVARGESYPTDEYLDFEHLDQLEVDGDEKSEDKRPSAPVAAENNFAESSAWRYLDRTLSGFSQVEARAPALVGQGMLSFQGKTAGVLVEGIVPETEKAVSDLPEFIIEGSWEDFRQQEFGAIIGMGIAYKLGAVVGDSITLIMPSAMVTPLGFEPRMKRFKVSGIFKVGNGFSHDDLAIYTHLGDLNRLIHSSRPFNRVHLKLKDIYQAGMVRELLNRKLKLAGEWYASDWTLEYGAFFRAVKMEKNALFLLLMLIIAVASFNLVSGLTVMVTNKRQEIALLRTIGFSKRQVVGVFIGYGAMVGVLAVVVGTLLGLFLTSQAANIVSGLEQLLHQQLFNTDIYMVDNLPVRLLWQDVVQVDVLALLLTLLSTIHPALKSSKILPVQAMRYE